MSTEGAIAVDPYPTVGPADSTLDNASRPGFDISRFVENFAVLAEAEGGLTKLRQFILDLAVSGFLVEQAPGSARVNVEELASSSGYPLDDEPSPFALPAGWAWSRLGAISSEVRYGYTASARLGHHGVRLLRITDIQNDRVSWKDVPGCDIDADKLPDFQLHEGDLVIARTGGTIGKTYLVENLTVKAVFASYLIRAAPLAPISPRYLKAYSGSGLYWRQLYAGSAGTGQPNVNATTLKSLFVPIPPPDEQKRIVAKVAQLMALCDDLEARQTKKRETGTRLTKSALEALTSAEGPEELETAWTRVAENFGVVIDLAQKAPELRLALLDLAIQGRLATGSLSDESATLLLEQLRAERIAARGTASKTSPPEEVPFPLPPTWRWARLDQIWASITDGDHQPPPKSVAGIPFLTIGNVSGGRLDFSTTRHVPDSYFSCLDELRVPRRGDLLYTVVGSYGIPVLVDTAQPFCVQRHVAILKPLPSTNVHFLRHVMESGFVYRQAQASATGIAQPTVGLGVLRNFLIPVPPLAEQGRIVARVDQLMAVCHKLEARLRQVEDRAGKLVQAAVQELVASQLKG